MIKSILRLPFAIILTPGWLIAWVLDDCKTESFLKTLKELYLNL